MSVVIVLTPHGRRHNVKVQPNTALIKVLEETCGKFKFDASEYDLKHHKRIIDLTISFRFSGLPNNAQLEMVPAPKKRQDSEVELVVQLTDGSRIDGKFKPNQTLYEILQQLCADECDHEHLIAIYMRTEVTADKLRTTSLKELGLLDGRAMVRLIRRHPDAAKIQANVALNLQPKQSTEETDPAQNSKVRKTNESAVVASNNSLMQMIRKEVAEEKASEKDTNVEEKPANVDADETSATKIKANAEAMDITPVTSPTKQNVTKAEEAHAMEEEDDDDGQVHILGERNALLFTLDSARATTWKEPDSFFNLNVADLKLLIKGLRSDVQGNSDQPLMTAKLREMEEEQSQLSRLNRFKAVIIRVQFPNRYVLQGKFTPYETIEAVMDFVRPHLLESAGEFYLYTTPPKTVVAKELRLFEVNCVPSAILHFGCDEKLPNFLKEEILGKVSSAKAALAKAFEDSYKEPVHSQSDDACGAAGSSAASMGARPKPQMHQPSTSHSTEKMPKWFKSFAK